MPVSVADLAKYYADNPPPKEDSLADLEARLEALISPSYRNPFKFEPFSLPSLMAGALGTSKYSQLGSFSSVADVLKPPTVPGVTSLYPIHRAAALGTPRVPTISDLFAQRYGAPSSPIWEHLAETRRLVAGSSGATKFLYGGGNALSQALETLRPQLEKFGMFMQNTAVGLQSAETGIRRWLAEAAERAAHREAVVDDLLMSAYQAAEQIGRNKPQAALKFMRREFGWKQPSQGHVAAFWEALQADDTELREEMLIAPRPLGWLASRVAFRMRRTQQERDPRDLFCQKQLSPDQVQKLRGAGHKQHEDEGVDPGIIVARKYDLRRQTIEEIAVAGRPISQERAAVVRTCLDLGLDDEECRQILGEEGAWRALKTTAVNEREKLRKRFQENYPEPSLSKRYLHKRPY